MRIGVAIDLHATAATSAEVAWPAIRDQVLEAERLGFELVVLPDHLSYRAGGDGDYALDDDPVGVRESTTVAAAIAAVTSRIRIGHSVINAPYRTPAMLAHVAASLASISAGRYSLGIGVGNSFDYDQIGVESKLRVARFAECVEIVSKLMRDGHANVVGTHWSAADADLVLRPGDEQRPPIVVAAGGPRTMRVAVEFGDAWNGFCPTDPTDTTLAGLIALLERTCDEMGRDPASIDRTADVVVDPLDLAGARNQSIAVLDTLADLGISEVRCYPFAGPSHASRLEAIAALAELTSAS